MSAATASTPHPKAKLGGLAGVVGLLAVVEFTSGIIQGYYTPLLTDIARYLGIHDADVNWFEGTQLMLSALAVPALAKLGDIYGYRRVLLWSIAVVAVSLGGFAFVSTFALALIAWTVAGVYTVWLPLEIALVWARSSEHAQPAAVTRRASGLLVAALEAGAIAGALAAGQLVDLWPLQLTLLVPAIAVALCFVAVLLGVRDAGVPSRASFDTPGFLLLAFALVAFTGGLSLSPALGPIFITAGLFGVSVLGAQAPLSTFARTDPALGYGWGVSSGLVSVLIGLYVISMVVGALLFPVIARRLTPRLTLVLASLLVGVGYLLFVPFHGSVVNGMINMVIAGLGSGALVAALPAAAAAAAPPQQTGIATGLTNSVKTVGGAIASAVFAIALLGTLGENASASDSTAGSFTGYLTVWIVCGVTALVSAALLGFVVPRNAFQDAPSAVQPR